MSNTLYPCPINIKVTVRLKGIKMRFWLAYSLGGMDVLQDLT